MVFHVLNRGVGRMKLFHKDADYEAFERTVEEILEKYWYPGVPNCLVKNEAGYVALPLEATEVVKQQP